MKLNKMVFDDKKIEEAARGAADLYEQDLPMMSYYEDTEVDGQHHFCQEFGAELFKDGAKWAINEFLKNLWHPVSEKPEEHTDIIYIDEDKDFWDINNYDSNNFDDSFGKGWKSACRTQDIYKWAYKDDLFPKKGGEQ